MTIYHHVNQIIPQLWLGNYASSQDIKFINDRNIKVIINCTKDLPCLKINGVFKYRVPVDDNLESTEIEAMSNWIIKILPIIDHHYKKGRNILIHCYAGIQRSAIIMMSYLHKYHFDDPNKTYSIIKYKRPIVFTPYMNFRKSFTNNFKKSKLVFQ